MVVHEQGAPNRLLTLREAAAVLRVSVASVRRYAARGDLATVRLGAGSRAPIRVTGIALASFVRADDQSGATGRGLELDRDRDDAGGDPSSSGLAAGPGKRRRRQA
jgi:hypothetical protein